MNDSIEPKTESSYPSTTDLTMDELATPLLSDDDAQSHTNNGMEIVEPSFSQHHSISSRDSSDHKPLKDTILTSSQYLTAQCSTSNSEGSWDSHVARVTPPKLCSETLVHNPQKEVDISTSADTVIDNDDKFETKVEEKENSNKISNIEYQFVHCIAVINRITPNSSKILAISVIDSNNKSDGYAADHSGSSSASTFCAPIEEPFFKVPRDSLISMSSSSSGSSTGLFPNQSKLKPKYNVLLPKHINMYPDNLLCHKCNHAFQGVSGNFSNLDNKNFKSEPVTKTRVGKPRSRKKSKLLSKNNDVNKKKLKNTKQNITYVDDEIDAENEKPQNNNLPVEPPGNKINTPISFDICDNVLAYWVTDKLFYPATIIDILPPKFKVQFMSDRVIKPVNIDGLVHVSSLKPGISIAVLDTVSQECKFGEIVSINNVPNGEDTYTIDLGLETVVVPFDKLVLNVDKARMLQDKTMSKNYDRLSVSNVSEGKRIRWSRSTSHNVNNKTNTKNESSKRKKTRQEVPENVKKRKCLFPEEPDFKNIPSTSTGITRETHDVSLPSTSISDSEFDLIRENLHSINTNKLLHSGIDTDHQSPSDSNEKCVTPNSKNEPDFKPLKDLHFVITYAKFKRTAEDALLNDDDYVVTTCAFKKILYKKIPRFGGTAYFGIADLKRSLIPYSYIISDTYCQTGNYFVGVIYGLRAYHHKYIDMAIEQKRPFTEVIADVEPLPMGLSLELERPISYVPGIRYSKLLSNYVVYITFPNDSVAEFYASLVSLCGGVPYTKWKKVSKALTGHITVIVSDDSDVCINRISNQGNVPKLSYNWVLQSIIHGEVRPMDAHEDYIILPNDNSA